MGDWLKRGGPLKAASSCVLILLTCQHFLVTETFAYSRSSIIFAGISIDFTCTQKAEDTCEDICKNGFCSEYNPGEPVCFCHQTPESLTYTCTQLKPENVSQSQPHTLKPKCIVYGKYFTGIDTYFCTPIVDEIQDIVVLPPMCVLVDNYDAPPGNMNGIPGVGDIFNGLLNNNNFKPPKAPKNPISNPNSGGTSGGSKSKRGVQGQSGHHFLSRRSGQIRNRK